MGTQGSACAVFPLTPWACAQPEKRQVMHDAASGPNRGSVDKVVWACADRRAPGPTKSKLRSARQTSISEMMMGAWGALPRGAGRRVCRPTLGLECAGVVTRVGVRVDSFKAGENALAFGAAFIFKPCDGFRAAAAPLPPEMTCAKPAATIPVCFITVHYSLTIWRVFGRAKRFWSWSWRCRLAARNSRSLGARVIATAGQREKRVLLRNLRRACLQLTQPYICRRCHGSDKRHGRRRHHQLARRRSDGTVDPLLEAVWPLRRMGKTDFSQTRASGSGRSARTSPILALTLISS